MTLELPQAVLETIRRERLLPADATVLCAVSGGPDSIALLRVLLDLARERRCRVIAAHLDHGLRPDSAEDAEFCSDFAVGWGVPFVAERADWDEAGGPPTANVEAAARRVRYGFLRRVAAEHEAILAVGHNADDRAETFLAQLLRGAGARGLSLPRYRREDGVIRPLLDCTRAQILTFLDERRIPYRTDLTNLDGSNLRSRIRRDVLPLLLRENPEVVRAIGRTAAQLGEVDGLLEDLSGGALDELRREGPPEEFHLDGPSGRTYHRSILSALLRRVALDLGTGETVGFEHLERCVNAWKRAERLVLDVPGGVRVTVGPDRVVITRPDSPPPRREREVPVPGRVLWSEGNAATDHGSVHLTVHTVEPPADPASVSGPKRAWIDADNVVAPLRVRSRLPGDRYRPLGLEGSVKIQDLFVDRKIPRIWREDVPVIADERGILWIPGFRVDHRGRITEGTKTALRLEIEGDLPQVRESAG